MFFRRRDADDRLVEEINAHLSMLEEHYRQAGMSERDARDAALRAFGGVLKTRQIWREASWRHWLDQFARDVRHGTRLLTKNRGFALATTLVLGLGIGVNNMMVTIIYAHTLRGLPLPEADRVLMATFADERGTDLPLSWVEYEELRSANGLFELAAMGPTIPVALGDHNRAPDRYNATYVSANAFETLQARPIVGRTFTTEEEASRANVAVLGGRAWRLRYDSDASILGRTVLINGRAAIVVGVLPERSGFPSTAEAWLPLRDAPGLSMTNRESRALRVFGRVARGQSVDAAAVELRTNLSALAAKAESARVLHDSVTPISARFFGRPTDPAWLAFITAGFLVLAVSCANVANLMLARGTQRAREMAIRGSMGATRQRMFVQMLIESSVIAVVGSAIGLALSLIFVRVFRSFVPADALSYWLHYTMDMTVFVALVLVAVGTVFIFGILPAIQASRTDVIRVLRDGGWGGTSHTTRRWTSAFMAVQIALAVVLLAQGVTNWINTTGPSASDRIISRTPDVITGSLSLSGERYQSPQARAAFYHALTDRLATVPGVTAATLTSTLPRQGGMEQRLQLVPGAGGRVEDLPRVWIVSVANDFFATLRIPLLQGSDFPAAIDRTRAHTVAIVNRRFVSMYLNDGRVLDRSIEVIPTNSPTGRVVTIVGISEDITFRDELDPVVYLPMAATAPANLFAVVRSTIDTAAMTSQLRDAVFALDANLPVFRVMTLERALHDAGWNPRISNLLIRTLILIVLTLSGVGLYATTSQTVNQRAKEFGIRVAVGARPSQLWRIVVQSSARHVGLGLALGVIGAMAWGVAFGSENAGGPIASFAEVKVLAPIAGVLLSIMAAACAVPIRHAVRVDPVATLRQD